MQIEPINPPIAPRLPDITRAINASTLLISPKQKFSFYYNICIGQLKEMVKLILNIHQVCSDFPKNQNLVSIYRRQKNYKYYQNLVLIGGNNKGLSISIKNFSFSNKLQKYIPTIKKHHHSLNICESLIITIIKNRNYKHTNHPDNHRYITVFYKSIANKVSKLDFLNYI